MNGEGDCVKEFVQRICGENGTGVRAATKEQGRVAGFSSKALGSLTLVHLSALDQRAIAVLGHVCKSPRSNHSCSFFRFFNCIIC